MSQIIKIDLIQKIRMDRNLAGLTNGLVLVVLEDQDSFVHLGLEQLPVVEHVQQLRVVNFQQHTGNLASEVSSSHALLEYNRLLQ